MIQLYYVAFGVFFAVSGVGHVISIAFDESRGIIVAVIFVALSTVLGGIQPSYEQVESTFGEDLSRYVLDVSFVRHSITAFYLCTVAPFQHIYNLENTLKALRFSFDDVTMSIVAPFIIGGVARIGALILLYTMNKKLRR